MKRLLGILKRSAPARPPGLRGKGEGGNLHMLQFEIRWVHPFTGSAAFRFK